MFSKEVLDYFLGLIFIMEIKALLDKFIFVHKG